MFAFGYALVPIYRTSAMRSHQRAGAFQCKRRRRGGNTQIDLTRTVTIEFTPTRGPWDFRPAQSTVDVHPGR